VSAADVLDVRVLSHPEQEGQGPGVEVEALQLAHPGLARDLFLQFAHPSDPVSVSAKRGFAARLRAVMEEEGPAD
jgi:hypothetical protein